MFLAIAQILIALKLALICSDKYITLPQFTHLHLEVA